MNIGDVFRVNTKDGDVWDGRQVIVVAFTDHPDWPYEVMLRDFRSYAVDELEEI